MPETSEKVEFEGAQGDRLSGRLHRPAGPVRAHALFAHCFTCSKDIKAAVAISQALAARGIATLRFDFTGLGESEGDFADTHFSSNIEDLVAAARHMEAELAAPSLLVGHSLGGAAALAAAGELPSVEAVATIGAPCDPAHVSLLLEPARAELADRGEAEVRIAGRTFRVKRALLDDLRDQRQLERIRDLRRALLIFHSPQDSVVGVEHARHIYEAARHPKSYVSLDGADHLLRRRADAEYVAEVLAAWASRYLPEPPDSDVELGAGDVWVEGARRGYQTRVRTQHHGLCADEPTAVGGDDTGPNPYELLLAALGACTSMTLRMYADRKGWPLEDVGLTLRHERIHTRDCEDCETENGHVDRIHRRLRLGGDLDPDQRQRLVEIADRCPVHRTLTGEVKIETKQEP